MAALGRFFGKFFGRTIGDAASFAIGGSISRTIDPALQAVENEAWTTAVATGVSKPPSAGTLAGGIAQGQVAKGQAYSWAAESGYGKKEMDALVAIADTGPPLGQAIEAFRRGELTEAQYRTALKRQAIEDQWADALVTLAQVRLEPAVVAAAIQRGIMRDPGFLPVSPPTAEGKVPAFPVSGLDTLKEAAASGIDRDRLFVETALIGNSMGPQEAAHALFRGIIEEIDYERAIAEGRTRNEWGEPIREVSRAIPSTTNYIEGHLRDWITEAEMLAGTGRHGMTSEDTDLLFKVHGRPLSWHQTFIGLRRGGVYDGPITDIDAAFLKSLRESNIRPEWYNLAWAQRYNYPAAFVLRTLTKAGELTAAETEEILLFEGWEPTLANKVASSWAGEKPPAAKPKKLSNATIRSAWKKGNLTEPQALADLEANGLTAEDAAIYLHA